MKKMLVAALVLLTTYKCQAQDSKLLNTDSFQSRIVIAGLAIDCDAHVDAFAVTLTRGGCERSFERFEDDFLVDALLVGDCVNHHQNFFVHRSTPANPGRP